MLAYSDILRMSSWRRSRNDTMENAMDYALIVTGGRVNIDFIREYIRTLSYDKVFAVDKGLEAVDKLEITPDVIIGDFDSVKRSILDKYNEKIASKSIDTVKIEHPTMKDDSDTELAVKNAIDSGAKKITIIGATGSRMDHVLANLSLLIKMSEAGIEGDIVDETNRIRLLSSRSGRNEIVIEKENQFGKYVSLIPIEKAVYHVTMEGMLYPLYDSTLMWGNSLTISNEINEKTARIRVGDGTVLLIESRDFRK